MTLISSQVKQLAIQFGFELCAVTKVENIFEQQNYLDNWLAKKFNGTMDWFNSHKEMRSNPRLLVENAKSIIVFAKFYNPEVDFGQNPKIAKYALSLDYHYSMRHFLTKILVEIQRDNNITGKAFVDSAPILERYWAERSGIGWVGKNGLITTKKYGSLINLGFIIVDAGFDNYDIPIKKNCGNCSQCVSMCPTGCIQEHTLDARKCLSYITIEHKGELSIEQEDILRTKSKGMFFGCDKCLDVCPWNKKALRDNDYTHKVDDKFNLKLEQWYNLSSTQFNKKYRNTPLNRAGFRNIKRNIEIIYNNKKAL